MDGIYYVITRKFDGKHVGPRGVSRAPHLYETEGKANGQRNRFYRKDDYEVVPVQLTKIEEKGA